MDRRADSLPTRAILFIDGALIRTDGTDLFYFHYYENVKLIFDTLQLSRSFANKIAHDF